MDRFYISCNRLTIMSRPTDVSHETTKGYVDSSLIFKENTNIYVNFISFRNSAFTNFIGTTLPFNDTVLNVGSGYSTTTFTAPLKGIYFFMDIFTQMAITHIV